MMLNSQMCGKKTFLIVSKCYNMMHTKLQAQGVFNLHMYINRSRYIGNKGVYKCIQC